MNKNKIVYSVYLNGLNNIHVQTKNKKLGNGIHNISLLPGSGLLTKKDGTVLCNIPGTCAGCCKGCEHNCYAKRYTVYHHNTCVPAYADNTVLAINDPEKYWNLLQNYLDNNIVSVFRFHVSGEIPNEKYLLRMIELCENNKLVHFYIYTKRFTWIEKHADEIPENLHVLVSIWHKNYSNPLGFAEFIYDDGTEPELEKVFHCPAVDKNGNETGITCAKCKNCIYARKGDKIAVYAH